MSKEKTNEFSIEGVVDRPCNPAKDDFDPKIKGCRISATYSHKHRGHLVAWTCEKTVSEDWIRKLWKDYCI